MAAHLRKASQDKNTVSLPSTKVKHRIPHRGNRDGMKCSLAVMPLHGRASKIMSLLATFMLVCCAQLFITSYFEELLVSESAKIKIGRSVKCFVSRKSLLME